MRLPWLADCLRAAGLEVVEHGNWQDRGKNLLAVEAVICHHTATKASASDEAVCRVLINGRSDLPGPLCQLGLDRRGRYHLIAGGKGNHNGHGRYGNQTIGIEAFNDGVGEPWPARQVDAYVKGVAAICARLGIGSGRVLGHKESDPSRKIDPKGIDMGVFRTRVDLTMRRAPQDTTSTERKPTVVRNHVRTLRAPNGGYWHLQADGGIVTSTDGRGSPDAPFYGSVPGVGGLPVGSKAVDLVPFGDKGYAVIARHEGDLITAYHFTG